MELPCWRGAMLGLIWLTGVTWLFSGSQQCLLATNISPAVITAQPVWGWGRKKYHSLTGRYVWAGPVRVRETDNKWTEILRPSVSQSNVTCWGVHLAGLCGCRIPAGSYLHILPTVKSSLWSKACPPHWLRLATAYRALFLHVLCSLGHQTDWRGDRTD